MSRLRPLGALRQAAVLALLLLCCSLLTPVSALANAVGAVAPFLVAAQITASHHARLGGLIVLGWRAGETMSYGCGACGSPTFGSGVLQGNRLLVSVHPPGNISSQTRLIVAATSPASIGRFSLYAIDAAEHKLVRLQEGCLARGVSSVSATEALEPSLLAQVPCPVPQVSNPPGAEYVFWRGTDGNLWDEQYSDNSWSLLVALNSGPLGSGPAVAAHASGEQDVFWEGTQGSLWEMWYYGQWVGPVELNAGTLGSAPAVGVDASDNEYVFWRGTDRLLWEMFYIGGKWSAPTPLDSGALGSAPVVAVHPNGEQDVFWKGTDGGLWEMWYSGGWNGPANITSAGQLGSAPAVGVDASNNEYVYWQGTDGLLWQMSYIGAKWSLSTPINSGALGSAPVVAVHPNGEQDVFWEGTDGGLWEMWFSGGWNGPVELVPAGQLGSAPAAAVAVASK